MRDYSDVDLFWVRRIIRVDEKHIEIVRDSYTSSYEFENASECLENFLYLKNIRRENSVQKSKIELKPKSPKRLS